MKGAQVKVERQGTAAWGPGGAGGHRGLWIQSALVLSAFRPKVPGQSNGARQSAGQSEGLEGRRQLFGVTREEKETKQLLVKRKWLDFGFYRYQENEPTASAVWVLLERSTGNIPREGNS